MTWKEQVGSEFWKPENEGDELVGEVLGISTDGEFGNQYTIETAEHRIVVTPNHGVLMNKMRGVKTGDKVKIVFTGEQKPTKKGHNATKMYDVFVDE